jgi:hypothetical protein
MGLERIDPDENPSPGDLARGTPKRPVYMRAISNSQLSVFNHVHIAEGVGLTSRCIKNRWGNTCPVMQDPVPNPTDPAAVEEWLDG